MNDDDYAREERAAIQDYEREQERKLTLSGSGSLQVTLDENDLLALAEALEPHISRLQEGALRRAIERARDQKIRRRMRKLSEGGN